MPETNSAVIAAPALADIAASASERPAAAPRDGTGEWYLVGVLTAVYTINYMDRGVLNLIVNPIRDDLHASDLQISFLLGLSFMVLYSVLSVPAGFLADVMSRRLIIFVASIFWSAMQTLCGFANSYWQLFAGRVGLGVGEAANPPPAYSLLRDGVSEKHRGRAFAIYGVSPILGTGFGALIGGWVYGAAAGGTFAQVPILGHLRPWQLVIAVPGLIGLPLSVLLLTIREPARLRTPGLGTPSFGELLRHVRAQGRLYGLLLAGIIGVSLAMGFNAWLAAALSRQWGLSPAVIGKTIGPMGLIISPLTYLVIGSIMDRAKRRTPWGPFQVSIVGSLLNIGPTIGVLLAPTLTLAWISLGLSMLLTGAVQISCTTTLADITPSRLMGKVTAFYFMLSNLLGLAIGPTFYALVAQWFFSGPLAIVHAMIVCYPVLMLITIGVLLLAVREMKVRRALA